MRMERKNLADYISRQTLEQLTEEAFGAPAKKRSGFSRGLALAACLALVVMVVNLDTVYAAVQKLLYFLPGSGGVSEEAPQDYWLPQQEYTAVTPQGEYVVSYLYRRGDTLALGVKKEVTGTPAADAALPSGEPAAREQILQEMAGEPAPEDRLHRRIDLAVDIRDSAGNLLELESARRNIFSVDDTTTGDGSAEVQLELDGFTLERFTLVLDGTVEFPVELHRVDPADYSMGSALTARDAVAHKV